MRVLKLPLLILLAATALRTAVAVTLGLSDDEAWYWALSERLQAAYAVHPPLSAWLIRISTAVFGVNAFAVRLPAIACSALGTWWMLRLVVRLGWKGGATLTALLCVAVPFLFAGGILVGPDLPLFAFWAGMMETAYALSTKRDPRPRDWIRLGVLAGLALLSKYTAALGVAAAFFSLLSTREGRRHLRGPWPYAAFGVAVAVFSPVLFWNAANGWVSFHFQFVERHGSMEWNFRRWGVFWISQVFLMTPALVYGWFALLTSAAAPPATGERPDETERSLRFLAIWAAVPGFVFFLQPIFSPFKVHWALFAYLPVLVYFAKGASTWRGAPRLARVGVISGAVLTAVGMASLYLPLVPSLTKTFTGKTVDPKQDVSNDFYGWDTFARHWRALPGETRGLPLVSARYQNAAQAAFSLGSRRNVHIHPHEAADLRDWGGEPSAPARFLYLTDNRYDDDPAAKYPRHHCASLSEVTHLRWNAVAKRFRLRLCELRGR